MPLAAASGGNRYSGQRPRHDRVTCVLLVEHGGGKENLERTSGNDKGNDKLCGGRLHRLPNVHDNHHNHPKQPSASQVTSQCILVHAEYIQGSAASTQVQSLGSQEWRAHESETAMILCRNLPLSWRDTATLQ